MNDRERLKHIREYLVKHKRINELKKQKNYNQIFEEFGQETYSKYVPNTIKRKEIKKFKKEGNFEAIIQKYGEEEYNKYISYMLRRDAKYETGNCFKATKAQISYKLQKLIKETIPSIGMTASILSLSLLCIIPVIGEIEKNDMLLDNAIAYESQLNEYNNNLKKYTENMKQLIEDNNLSDVDIFMKVMDDMWESIEGYGSPELNVSGYMRLDIQNGVGVCRNMADDVAEKLNAINPNYNAQVISCYMDDRFDVANIERNVLTEETVSSGESKINFDISKFTGNHAIVVVEVDGMRLLLDPTNPNIGVIKNGELLLLNSDEHATYKDKYIGNAFVYGITAFELEQYLIESYFNTPSLKELKEKYGLEVQNASLEKVRQISSNTISR